MKNRIRGLVSISLLVLSGIAIAAGSHGGNSGSNFYIGAGYNFLETEAGGFDWDTSAVDIRVGKYFTPNFAIEGRGGFGVSDDTAAGLNVEINNYFGVYARGEIPINSQFSIYGLLGITDIELDVSAGGNTVSGTDNDVSWGVGASFAINPKTSIGGEYMNLYDDGGVEISGFGINFQQKF